MGRHAHGGPKDAVEKTLDPLFAGAPLLAEKPKQPSQREGGVVLYFSPSVRPEQTIAGGVVLT